MAAASLDKYIGHQLRFTLSSATSSSSSSSQPRKITGKLWACDPSLGAAALETVSKPLPALLASAPASAAAALHASRTRSSAAPSTATPASTAFEIVKISEIKRIEFLTPPHEQQHGAAAAEGASVSHGLTPVHPVSLAAAQAREAHAVKLSLAKAAKLGGKEVSEIGQLVFDALSKTLPCRWHNSHIIVLDEVVISGPGYDSSSTNVPNFTPQQLRSYIDGTATASVPEGAQAKANSWNRVVKVLEGERRKILANQST